MTSHVLKGLMGKQEIDADILISNVAGEGCVRIVIINYTSNSKFKIKSTTQYQLPKETKG